MVLCPSPTVVPSSNKSADPSGHLPLPSHGQQSSFAPPSPSPSTCALFCPPSPANPHASNHPPSLTSAVLSSTQAYHSCLPAPSSALSSPFNTLPALQHVSNLQAIIATCTLLYHLVTVHHYLPLSRATQCTHYHYLGRLASFFQSFTSHSPARSRRRILLTDIKYIPLFHSTVLVLI